MKNCEFLVVRACLLALVAGVVFSPAKAALSVNFGTDKGAINPKLHSAHYAPPFYRRSFINIDSDLQSLNFYASRTHDWALFNGGARIVDTHFVFPLIGRNPSEPGAYNFKATDEAIRLTRNCGMKIFYRFGTSIERTTTPHFNSLPPKYNGSYDHYADACSHIVSHYNEGWNNGYNWDIQYWEIWNEPDLSAFTWTSTQDEFAEMFATVLKKVKTDHPNVKVGGPAIATWNSNSQTLMTKVIAKCQEKGVLPDFFSWHYYGNSPNALIAMPASVRTWLDSHGCSNTETIIDEWHYFVNGYAGVSATVSAVFNTAVLSRFQYTSLNQAYNYGIAYEGVWGLTDNCAGWNKNFYSYKMFGDVVKNYDRLVSATNDGSVYILGALNSDKTKGCILVSDFTTSKTSLTVTVSGLSAMTGITMKALDDNNNYATVSGKATYSSGTLTITKPLANAYGAYLVTFTPTLSK